MFTNPWYGSASNGSVGASNGGGDASNPWTDVPAVKEHLEAVQAKLKAGWTVHVHKDGRLYYCNHALGTSSWLPPSDNYDAPQWGGLPYGWECATDKDGKPYYINHLNKTTTYEDPGRHVAEDDEAEAPSPRDVELTRHAELGFGFVAGSERPVIVRFVTEGGPSDKLLQPGDQIWAVNGEDVRWAPRDRVIQLVRACNHSVHLTVCQPLPSPQDPSSSRKSAMLSAAKKARLKSHPSRVRFAEGVVINGSPFHSSSAPFWAEGIQQMQESCVPFLPNVLKVFLENGQTKSFKYDSSTTVKDVLDSLQQKLSVRCPDHFSLVVEHVKALRKNKLTILDPQESLARIAARPGSQHLRCLYRVSFVPKDAYELLRKDSTAFEYLYTQCCNDVVGERFAPELKYEVALRLAALQILQHSLAHNLQGKLTVKAIEREFGIEKFVPASLIASMKRKELRKLLAHFLKQVQAMTPGANSTSGSNSASTNQRHLLALQAKLHYLNIMAQLPSYGAKCFPTNARDGSIETVILVSPKFGLSQISPLQNTMPVNLCDIENLTEVSVSREDEVSLRVELCFKDPDQETLTISFEDRDAEEFVLVLCGYYKLLVNRSLNVIRHKDPWTEEEVAPPYHTQHRVVPAAWSYPISSSTLPGRFPTAASVASGGRQHQDNDSLSGTLRSSSSSASKAENKQFLLQQEGSGAGESSLADLIDQKNRDFLAAISQLVDLTLCPPYHKPPPGFEIPNGSYSKATAMEIVKQGEVDANMNKTFMNGTLRRDTNQNVTTTTGVSSSSSASTSSASSASSSSSGTTTPTNRRNKTQRGVYHDVDLLNGASHHVNHQHQYHGVSHHVTNSQNNKHAVTSNNKLAGSFDVHSAMAGAETKISSTTTFNGKMQNGDAVNGSRMRNGSLAAGDDPGMHEARNDVVIRRVAEMKHLVETAEKYLTDQEDQAATDTEKEESMLSDGSGQYGQLKHSDSLLLLMQQGKEPVRTGDESSPESQRASTQRSGVKVEQGSGSDTDSLSTPTNSPMRNPKVLERPTELKTKGSSFGLHSPGEFPSAPAVGKKPTSNVADVLKQLAASSSLPYNFVEGTFVLDPEIIDLTMIPPPITPDEEGLKAFPAAGPSLPPTPFADRMNLEAELKALERNFGPLKDLGMWPKKAPMSTSMMPPLVASSDKSAIDTGSDWDDTMSMSSLNTTMVSGDLASTLAQSDIGRLAALAHINSIPSSLSINLAELGYPVAAAADLMNGDDDDIDSFIANATVPPPPSAMVDSYVTDAVELTHDDISQFIIPPPPSLYNDENDGSSGKNGVSLDKDRAVHEVKIATDVKSLPNGIGKGSPVKLKVTGPRLPGDGKPATTVANRDTVTNGWPISKSATTSPAHKQQSLSASVMESIAERKERLRMALNGDSSPVATSTPTPPKLPPKPSTTPTTPTKVAMMNGSAGTITIKCGPNEPPPLPPRSPTKAASKPPLPPPIGPESPKPALPARAKPKPPPLPKKMAPKKINGVTSGGPPPLLTSSPKSVTKNGNGSFDSSIEQDSLETSFDSDSGHGGGVERQEKLSAAFIRARAKIQVAVTSLDRLASATTASYTIKPDEHRHLAAKDVLTTEARQFVTASKLFVKSATESETRVLQCLDECVTMLAHMARVTQTVAETSDGPKQNQELLVKVKDVGATFLKTVEAAAGAVGKNLHDPSMNVLMKEATALASVLTALMRTLRVIPP